MNGNVAADQAVADLDWAAAQGIGGVHLFEGGLGAAQVVGHRLVYMSPEWKDALRASLAAAKRLGLDFSIATSPGWSATGGPSVAPRDAMKKLVWSAVTVGAGARPIRLSPPSAIAGPYLDVPGAEPAPAFYRDVAVVAFPAPDALPPLAVSASSPVDAAMLRDGRFGATVRLQPGKGGAATITYRAARAVTVRAVQAGLPAPVGFGVPPPPFARIEASDDGQRWRIVASLPPSAAPARTATFAPVKASWFRLVIRSTDQAGFLENLHYEPGAAQLRLPPPEPGFAVSEFDLFGASRVNAAEQKAGFAAAPDYYALASTKRELGIDAASVLDLTDRMRSDGTLDWAPPAGRWTVLRFGMSLTGHHNGPAPQEATGLEVDKLSAPRVAAYLNHYLDSYDQALAGTGGLNGLISDSIEAGAQNWTDAMPAEFRRRRGYALTRFLPALAGYIVADSVETDAFLYDFRRTIADLVADAHYKTISRIAAERGLTYYAEALEDGRPQLGDDLAIRSVADVPAGAMWFFEAGGAPRPTYDADLLGAASVAHVAGRPIVAVEALTSFGYPWALSPARMRATADRAFLRGGNRLMLHSMVHQAAGDTIFPGQTMIPLLGHNFNRNEAWAPFARGWIDYLSRSQFLLQQGRPQADFAYFVGEEAPVTGLFGDAPPQGVPDGFSFDFVDSVLLDGLSIEGGATVNRSGGRYAFVFLGGSSRWMTSATLARLEAMAAAGVTIAGRRPLGSPSLADAGTDYRARIDVLWRRPNVIDAATPAEAVAALRLTPRWAYSGKGSVAVLQRTLDDADIYFVVNQSAAPAHGVLRLTGRRAKVQWWDAVTGAITAADVAEPDAGVAVDLEPSESRFLLVRDGGEAVPAAAAPREIARVDGPWQVTLASRGRPARELRFTLLKRFDRSEDQNLREFSGIVTYLAPFRLPSATTCPGGRRWIELGALWDVARVTVNDRPLGTVWTRPFRLDATDALQPGINLLTVEVANLWKNRLVAEAREGNPAAQVFYRADAPLLPAGLEGPVKIVERCPR
jgi:hypothetical protein